MIHDKIDHWKIYFKNPVFNDIFNELDSMNIHTPDGVYQNNTDYYFKVMSYSTKITPTVIESHKKEVDIQILLSGSEKIKLYDFQDVQIIQPYNEETDCQFYRDTHLPTSVIDLIPGYMAVFFPQDIHHPQFVVNDQISSLKKIVIKVNAKLFTSE
jgi:YhcH/YjgK/YiaL family protein